MSEQTYVKNLTEEAPVKKNRLSPFDIDRIENEEKAQGRFAKGINFYKLFWIFLIGSFMGVIVEIAFCYATMHKIESRSGLIYGPFNLVYGFGALAVAAGLHWMRNKRDLWVFLGGVLIGSVVEYVSSLTQEVMIGTISWDYSYLPFSVAGRINLFYSLFWGILAILWVKFLYPLISLLIMKIPNRAGKPLTFVLLAFMIFNTIMSSLAVYRWNERVKGEDDSTNVVWEYFDTHYPNDRMLEIYPNMRFFQDDGTVVTNQDL